jgi:hypothetical protein
VAHTVVLTDVASLVAGAFSMGTGEYISVTNQNELVGVDVAVKRRMHARIPAAEQAELAEVFRGYGVDPDTAAALSPPIPIRRCVRTPGRFPEHASKHQQSRCTCGLAADNVLLAAICLAGEEGPGQCDGLFWGQPAIWPVTDRRPSPVS